MIGVCTVSLEHFVPWMTEVSRPENAVGVGSISSVNKENISHVDGRKSGLIEKNGMIAINSDDTTSIEISGIIMHENASNASDDVEADAEAVS